MRVKSIVLDGFKSYAHRKALDDLSPHFNAITGLNGSGKSNIFDAICFVMGITNLKRVRAEDPRELIFRAGTTGVHAARVTIEFINDDPRTAPPGYSCEEYPILTVGRQIKLGGKQQFFLNNTVSMQSKVKRFFESISLNVDNPHFMVLQGTVHKLIGMRSQDILSLIEEAVGTKAFDHRRRTAESLIRSKEKKMQEIDDNIETQIGPMLRAMKADQEEYERFVQMTEGIEEKRRFRIAFEYETHRQQLEQRRLRRDTIERDAAALRTELDVVPECEERTTRRLLELQTALAAPADAALSLRDEESTLLREVARHEAQHRAAQDAVNALSAAALRAESDRAAAQCRVEQYAAFAAQREELLTRVRAARDEVLALKRALQLHDAGVRAGASGRSLAEERAEAQRRAVHLSAEARRAEERLCEAEAQRKCAEERFTKAAKGEIARLQQKWEEAQAALAAAEESYAPLRALEARHVALRDEVTRIRTAQWEANDALQREDANGNTAAATVGAATVGAATVGGGGGVKGNGGAAVWRGFDVPYDRRALPEAAGAIHGRVAQLVAPREARFGIALSAGGGAQLMRVVVDTDADAARLITHGGLRQRTAFMPLNTLQRTARKGLGAHGGGGGCGIDAAKLAEARRIAARFASEHRQNNSNGNVNGGDSHSHTANNNNNNNNMNNHHHHHHHKADHDAYELDAAFVAPASELVVAANESLHRPVADAVFGSFLVCSSLRLAQELAYAPGVRCKAVSLDGDVAEPSGLITGGATQQLRNVFADAEAYAARRAPVDALARELRSAEESLSSVDAEMRRHADAIARFKSSEATAAVAAERLRIAREEVEAPLAECTRARDAAAAQRLEADSAAAAVAEQCARLERMDCEDPDAQLSALRAQHKEAQARHAALAAEESAGAAEFERIDAETAQLVADLERKAREAREEMALRATAAERIGQETAAAQEALRDVIARREAAEAQRAMIEREVDDTQQELQRLVARRSTLESAVKNAELELREAARGVDEAHRALGDAERRHPWLLEERGMFDFTDRERTAATLQELREAESQAAVMSKRLNRKATVLYEERRREYDELVQQRAALGEDRDAIQQCILGIEEKKWKALDRMVRVVSSVFSRLFATCLPGAAAALREERDTHEHLSGLQVRVMFNGKEKESLSELSGGQRSLLALCLILAILRVRQAPMYILDEVDAALDPSHTQNIGRMLQTHFPTSQFLLVSLKDGMFNNADVLYQVSNTQGYSEIARIESAANHAQSSAALS